MMIKTRTNFGANFGQTNSERTVAHAANI